MSMSLRSRFTRGTTSLALAAAVTLTAGGGGLASAWLAPAASAYSETRVDLRVSKTSVAVGSTVVFTLSVQPRMNGRVATLQTSVNGKGGWQSVKTVRTDRTGVASWSVVFNSQSALYYRAVVQATTRYSPATSEILKITVAKARTTLTVTWPSDDVVNGGDQITGKATPPDAGRWVYLERYDEDIADWEEIDSDRVDSKGSYDVSLDYGTGTHSYRVRVPATRTSAQAVSPERDITFNDGSGNYQVEISWPSGEQITEDDIVSGVINNLESGSYDVVLEFIDPDTGDWTDEGTEGAIVDSEFNDFSLSFYGLSGYYGSVRLVIRDEFGDLVWASDPYDVDVA